MEIWCLVEKNLLFFLVYKKGQLIFPSILQTREGLEAEKGESHFRLGDVFQGHLRKITRILLLFSQFAPLCGINFITELCTHGNYLNLGIEITKHTQQFIRSWDRALKDPK